MQLPVYTAIFAVDRASTPPFLDVQTGGCAVGFEKSRFDHHRLRLKVLSRQLGYHLSADAFIALSLMTVMERLGMHIFWARLGNISRTRSHIKETRIMLRAQKNGRMVSIPITNKLKKTLDETSSD